MTKLLGMVLAVIIRTQLDLLRKVGQIMATLTELNDSLASIKVGVDNLEAAIADLKRFVRDGGVVDQAALDTLATKASEIVADISDTSDQE